MRRPQKEIILRPPKRRISLAAVALDVENLKGGMASLVEVVHLMRAQLAEIQKALGIKTANDRELARAARRKGKTSRRRRVA